MSDLHRWGRNAVVSLLTLLILVQVLFLLLYTTFQEEHVHQVAIGCSVWRCEAQVFGFFENVPGFFCHFSSNSFFKVFIFFINTTTRKFNAYFSQSMAVLLNEHNFIVFC